MTKENSKQTTNKIKHFKTNNTVWVPIKLEEKGVQFILMTIFQ